MAAFYAEVTQNDTQATFTVWGGNAEYSFNGGTWYSASAGAIIPIWVIGTWAIRGTTITQITFAGWGLTHINITDASSLTSAANLADDMVALQEVYINPSNSITTFQSMVDNCQNLTTINAMVTSSCVKTKNMCADTPKLVNVPSMDYSNVTDAGGMFANASSLEYFYGDIGGDGTGTFSGCTKLKAIIGLITFNDYDWSFNQCPALEYIGGVNTIGAANKADMFGSNTNPTTPDAATQTLLKTTSIDWVASYVYLIKTYFEHGNRTIDSMSTLTFEHGDRTVDTRISGTFELDRYIYKKSLSTFALKRIVGTNTLQTQRFRCVRKVDAETQSSTIIARTTV